MADQYWLKITLESETAFGRGDGVAGLINAEVQHDQFGLPFVNGRTIKGLLVAQCAEVLHALDTAGIPLEDWNTAALMLFGKPGSKKDDQAKMRIGAARLPADLRSVVYQEFREKQSDWQWVKKRNFYLDTFTSLRQQTAIDAKTGAPASHSLRTTRTILPGVIFYASVAFSEEPNQYAKSLMAAAVKGLRRGGTNRNRGLGKLTCDLLDKNMQSVLGGGDVDWFKEFSMEVTDEGN